MGKRLAVYGALVVTLCSTPAWADTWLVGTVASYHTDRTREHNERNWGLGLEHGLAKNLALSSGFYRNSYYVQSSYAGVVWTPFQVGPVHIGAFLGGVSGYDNGFGPMILPTLSIAGKQWGVNLGVMPSPKQGVGVFGLQVKYNLGKF